MSLFLFNLRIFILFICLNLLFDEKKKNTKEYDMIIEL